MPLYDYRCTNGHTVEKLRKYDDRELAPTCHCGAITRRIPSAQHCVPDGVYSYAPNLGDPEKFERRQQAIKDRKIIHEGG